MALRLVDETAAKVVLEISGGGALVGIGGAPDSVHILAVVGNPIIKSNGVAYDSTVQAASGITVGGTVILDGSGTATISTLQSQPVVVNGGQSGAETKEGVSGDSSGSFTLKGGAGATRNYCYW